MPPVFRTLLAALLLAPALLLSSPASAQSQSGFVAPSWDMEQNLAQLGKTIAALRPIIDQIDPQNWEAAGASPSYAQQKKSLLAEIDAMPTYMADLVRRPENLPLALEILYRAQSIEARVHTLAEGLRRYQNPSLSHLILSMVASTHAGRDQLFQYCLDFARQREAEFKIADEEAQRCRASLSKQPR